MSGWWMEVVPPTDQELLSQPESECRRQFSTLLLPDKQGRFPCRRSFLTVVCGACLLLLKQWQLLFLLFPATILFFLCIIRFLPTILIIPSNLYFSIVQ